MESVLGRYRNLIILVGVLFLQVLGLAVQVKRSTNAEHTRLIRVWAVTAITPFERGLVWLQNGGDNLWHNYFFLRGVRAENRELKKQIEDMRLKQVRLTEDAAQANRLQALLAFKEQIIFKTVAAQVIGSSGSDLSRSIYIDKGEDAGLKPDMAVITSDGIVGKVWMVYPSTSLVLMINDQSSGVGAMVEKSRLQGVVRGTPEGELVLERVMSDETVNPSETLLSSGGDRIFPKGLPLGVISKVSPGKEMFLNIHVKPAADLSRVEEVLVVTDKQDREPAVAESGARTRAADILAQRLPSVPDKPAVAPATPGRAAHPTAGASTPPAESAPSAVIQPPPNIAFKPATPATTGSTNKPALIHSANPSAANISSADRPATSSDVLKKVVQKNTASDSVLNKAPVSAAAASPTPAANTSAATGFATKPANPPAKKIAPPTATTPPSNTPPPATEDSPH
jgi:rod shape-determining protein MreC